MRCELAFTLDTMTTFHCNKWFLNGAVIPNCLLYYVISYSTWHNRGGILLHPESVTLVSLDWVWILSNNLHQQIMPFHHVFTLRSCMQNNGGITVLFCNWWKGYFSLPAYSVSIHGHEGVLASTAAVGQADAFYLQPRDWNGLLSPESGAELKQWPWVSKLADHSVTAHILHTNRMMQRAWVF